MDDQALITLANRVAERYAALPCRDETVAAIGQYIGEVWPPVWKARLSALARVDPHAQAPVARLDEAVLAAAQIWMNDALASPSLPPAYSVRRVQRVQANRLHPALDDQLAEEVPVALEYNGISHATMLATPLDLEDFARGFSLTEGIVDTLADVRGVDVVPQADGVVVRLEIATACEVRLKHRRRALAGRTGCGLCGVETLDEVLRVVTPLPPGAPVAGANIGAAQRAMRARQRLHDATGATHAAAWVDAAGELRCVREDVGRHNALDKLIGATAHLPRAGGMAVVSSRASFEMAQKSIAAGIDVLAAVSAPTALAARLAESHGLMLIGFLRGDDFTVYTGSERLRW